MRILCASALLPLFLGAMLIAHPAVAASLDAPRLSSPASSAPATAPQLPIIDAAWITPLPSLAYRGAHGAVDDLHVAEARLHLRRANRAIAFGVLGLIFGPVFVVLGLVFMLTFILFVAGVVFIVWGGVWFVLALPFFIGGLIGAGISRDEIDRAELGIDIRPTDSLPPPAWEIPIFVF